MSDNAFLKFFITEPVYKIAGEEIISNSTEQEPQEEQTPEPTVVVEEEKPQEKQEQPISIKGANSLGVIVIVNEPSAEFITDQDEAFLGKILKAVKLDITKTGIINAHNNPGLNQHTSMDIEANKFLLFGIDAAHIFKSDFPHYQIIEAENKVFLNNHSLSEIAKDSELKKLLWGALQKMFL
ncbi:hypothetical protein LVD15_00575 [Fulvivirga maritima]|uniref:hypothetical protein n=1 Tax=Fulvivirga maritima TaxID=2904247 RepID=UPI001F247FEC|nr:hypothetical protein [Fulvivirga maritima]UII26964.1 hypothetical protein LVD15_00575 [Fulvivirga maritima]